MMKNKICTLIVFAAALAAVSILLGSQIAQADINGQTLLLADEINTVAVNDSGADWANANPSGEQWDNRSEGQSGAAFNDATDPQLGRIDKSYQATNNSTYQLKTTISGLTAGRHYRVWILHSVRNPDHEPQQYGIRAGFEGNSLTPYMTRTGSAFPTAVLARDTGLGSHQNDIWLLYEAELGFKKADANGEVDVFVAAATADGSRTIYHGLAYEPGNPPIDPQPANQARIGDPTSLTNLSWNTPNSVAGGSFSVYFGSENDYNPLNPEHFGLPLVQSNISTQSIALPETLTPDMTYYWMVDYTDAQGETVSGDLWRFHTSGEEDLSWLEPYNQVWTSQSSNSLGSMPTGGHDIGLNVWVENGDVLFYMQRSGSLAETNEYLKLGRVRIQLTPNPFENGTFRQELKLKEGLIEIEGQTTFEGAPLTAMLKIWVETDRPIIHVEVESNQDIVVDAAYENWRLADESLANTERRHTNFTFHSYPGDLTLSKDTIQRVGDGLLFYHRNPSNAQAPSILIAQQRMEAYADQIGDDILNRTFGGMLLGNGFVANGETNGQYLSTPYKGWKLVSESPTTSHKLRVVTHIDQAETFSEWQADLQARINASANDLETARSKSLAWWEQFWGRSWIIYQPDDPDPSSKAWRAARNYNLFRYQLGTNAYGEYPTKFNGSNFIVDSGLVNSSYDFGPDWRRWGGGIFTSQNQRLVYWPMLKSGDFDAFTPQIDLYRKALPGAKARVTEHFEHDGAVFSEYNNVPGIAAGMGWGWESGGRRRATEIPFGDARADANRRDLVEEGVMTNPSISYHWSSQLEHSYMALQYHLFTGNDISQYMPFIENSLIFFDEHYRAREEIRNGSELNAAGKLVIYPSTAVEAYRGATNPVDVISGLVACLESLLELDESLLSLRSKAYYQNFLNTVPELPYGQISGQTVMKPADSYLSTQSPEMPQFYPLFPFNNFDLVGADNDQMQTFRDTWDLDPTLGQGNVVSWHQDGIFLARMGMTTEAAAYNLRKLEDSGRRYPTFWGPGHDWVPDHNWGGSGMIGLQEMVLQTTKNELHVLPAWPPEWDLSFKLHAPNQMIVEGDYSSSEFQSLIVSKQGENLTIDQSETVALPFSVIDHSGGTPGQEIEATSQIVATGNLVNNGTLILADNSTLDVGGTFINNGTLDITNWSGSLPANFVNNGVIIPDPVLMGDVNCNEVVDVVDALFIIQYTVAMRTDSGSCPLGDDINQIHLGSGDVSDDEVVDVVDALFIMQCEVGINNGFCP